MNNGLLGGITATDANFGSPKAWVLFNGNAPLKIIASYNVGTVVRNATGDYTVTIKEPMTRTAALAGTTKADGGVSSGLQVHQSDKGQPGFKRIIVIEATVGAIDSSEIFALFF